MVVEILTPQELNQASYIQAGLFELHAIGYLQAKIKLSVSKRLGTLKVIDKQIVETTQPHPKTSFYNLVKGKNGGNLYFAIDLYDAANTFSKEALINCDFIFKRNFSNEQVGLLPEIYRKKVYPLGLSFRVESTFQKEKLSLVTGFAISNLRIGTKYDSYFFNRIKKSIRDIILQIEQLRIIPKLSDFEFIYPGIENSILFQTRCFPHEDNDDVKEIHKQRYEICKFLMEHYGKQFKGGFIPSKLANEKYADAITQFPTDPDSYLNLVRNSKIVIYTRGLDHSPAWKMAEYLAMGKVIIAEEMTTELPVPLEHGKTVLFFRNHNELIENIDRVLRDDQLASTLSANARKYYEDNVHPKQNVKRIIELMLNNKGNE